MKRGMGDLAPCPVVTTVPTTGLEGQPHTRCGVVGVVLIPLRNRAARSARVPSRAHTGSCVRALCGLQSVPREEIRAHQVDSYVPAEAPGESELGPRAEQAG